MLSWTLHKMLTSEDFVRGVKLYQQDIEHQSRALQVQSACLAWFASHKVQESVAQLDFAQQPHDDFFWV